jgi:hypothetical protein
VVTCGRRGYGVAERQPNPGLLLRPVTRRHEGSCDGTRAFEHGTVNISTLTVPCPECGEPATLIRIEYPDENPPAIRRELEFECHNGHVVPDGGLADLWLDQDRQSRERS